MSDKKDYLDKLSNSLDAIENYGDGGNLINVNIKILENYPVYDEEGNAVLPTYKKDSDACCDVFAADSVVLEPFDRYLMPTGFCLGIPKGYRVDLKPRGGNAYKKGLIILNSPGTIDEGYIGQFFVALGNINKNKDIVINKGDRIAQMDITPYYVFNFNVVDELEETDRGSGSFGHTGGMVD